MKRLLLWIVLLASFVGALWAGWTLRAGNAQPIDVDLIFVRLADLELWWVLLLAIGFGASLATLILGFAWLRARLLGRRYRKAIQRLEAELHQMRSLPLVGSDSAVADEPTAPAAAERA